MKRSSLRNEENKIESEKLLKINIEISCIESVLQNEYMAEGVGFEPTDTLVSPVFKTGAFSRSATPPWSFLTLYFTLKE